MKKFLMFSFVLALMMSMAAMAQDTMKKDDDSMKNDTMKNDTMKHDTMKHDAMKADGQLAKVSGKVSDDGKTIVDKNNKSWTVQNPEALKGHEGHEVTLKAHVYNATSEVHVMSVKMAKSAMKDEMKKDDMKKDQMQH
jgi:pentapeptide MXKDX repeat protein